ncbi:MAG: quinone-dependent dihydroorotate dehydrogenase [Rhodocyclaceae bacterium]|nr:quinone-dependent dihydroorotate dehydrogenase [Rhodocyclaceae bacterium]
MPYCLLRPLVFSLDPETAHEAAIAMLRIAGALTGPGTPYPATPAHVMGLSFPNRIGLAAGLDKNGEAIDGLASWGFGFLEIGTVTPKAQAGNPKPRLFRLPQAEAIINRMGFNNHGLDALLANVRRARYRGILGINIGKNASTPLERALDDYLLGLEKAYPYASYVTVNISSPNTKNLRTLQEGAALSALLAGLKAKQAALADQYGRYVPLVLKIAPDLDDRQLIEIVELLRRHRCDGVIATNTTIDRQAVAGLPHAEEAGGLSGAPLFERATAIVHRLARLLEGEIPIIAAGGVTTAERARAKLEAGAALVQLYSGLIYHGPALVRACVEATHDWPNGRMPAPKPTHQEK